MEEPKDFSRAFSDVSRLERPLHSRTSSYTSDLNKPLPAPSAWGKLSIGTTRARYRTERKLSFPRRPQAPEARWRSTVRTGAIVAGTILLLNMTLLIYGFTKPLDDLTKTRVLAEGPCQSTRGLFTISHLAINAVSSILLATSNATMQCLVAPTREAVDKAHAKGSWLDVGVSSFRNWPYMEKWRKWCWVVLLFSSLPLHLLYNSVIFSATSANEYFALAVPTNFLDNPIPEADPGNIQQQTLHDLVQLAHTNKLIRMDNKACIDAYNQDFVTAHSNVLVVTKNVSSQLSLAEIEVFPTPPAGTDSLASKQSAWLCGDPGLFPTCDTEWLAAHPESFNLTMPGNVTDLPGNFTLSGAGELLFVDHCLLENTVPNCTLQFTTDIMIVVILCNALKVACFLTAIRVRSFRPLITLGDAIASFLRQSDPLTAGLGPVSAAQVRDAIFRARPFNDRRGIEAHPEEYMVGDAKSRASPIHQLAISVGPWPAKAQRWFSGAGAGRWSLAYTLMGSFWVLGVLVIGYIIDLSGGFPAIAAQFQVDGGFSNVATNFLMAFTTGAGTLGNIILANILQLLVSSIYFCYNSLFTSMVMSHEFSKYAQIRDTLRVSVPEGQQKSSYWLNLPYRYTLPILFLSANIHWGLSQGIFLAEVRTNNPQGGDDVSRSISCLGYSPLALLITLTFGFLMLAFPVIMGFKRLHAGAPVVECNSIAISAACHPEGKHTAEHLEHLKYGVQADTMGTSIGFSSKNVLPLQAGQSYADPQLETFSTPTQLPLQQKILLPVLGLLNVAKLVLVALWLSLGALTSPILHLFLPLAVAALNVIMSPLMVALLIYVVVRCLVAGVRWRKKWLYRRFGWHVVPEAILCMIFFILAAINFPHAQALPAEFSPDPAHNFMPVNALLAWSASLMSLFFVSTGIEYWLWRQQYRRGGLSILHSMIPSKSDRLKKKIRVIRVAES